MPPQKLYKHHVKRAAQQEINRLKEQDRRNQKKSGARNLRAPARADKVHETTLRVGSLRKFAAVWIPGMGTVVERISGTLRMVIGVAADEVPPMLAFLAGPLMRMSTAVLTPRGNGNNKQRWGASVILTTGGSSSDPHVDGTDTLLLNVAGTRHVWVAAPDAVKASAKRSSVSAGTTYLSSATDPSIHSLAQCAAKGVQWLPPVTLRAGDAIFIKAGWWHCILSATGGVAIPIEITMDWGKVPVDRGKAPQVYRRVGTCVSKDSSDPTNLVSRMRGGARQRARSSSGLLH